MKQEIPLSYQVWDESDVCPHCGSDGIEYTEEIDRIKGVCKMYIECLDCDRRSAVIEEVNDEVESADYPGL